MSKRTGLGRGLGAFFGDEYGEGQNQNSVRSKTAKTAESTKSGSLVETEEPEYNTEKKSLKELDMVLPTAKKTQKKQNDSGQAQKKNKAEVKIVEVEKEKYLNISLIEPNRNQPRKIFDEEQLKELAESIRAYGILQPILVKKHGDGYELIAGERRWRAAKLAGLKEVPVIVREYSEQQKMEIALIENVQREDLNPIEEAKAYQMLIQEFGLKQDEVAERVSKNRATITNSMRLLKLDERVQEMLIKNQITGGHARALLGLEDGEQQYQTAIRIINKKLSVREVERLVKMLTKPPRKEKDEQEENKNLDIFYHDIEEKLKSVMGTKVRINKKDKNKGRIEIEYYSSAELERLIEMFQSLA